MQSPERAGRQEIDTGMEKDLKHLWDLGNDFSDKIEEKKSHRRQSACYELSTKYLYRRAFSEAAMLDACSPPQFELKEGYSYNFITAGDIDSLSYLKVVLLHQHLSHCLCSTWCMAAEDILQLFQWHDEGKIGVLDIYVGEIFPSQYRIEWQMLKEKYKAFPDLGRLCVFRNHSKIYAGIGERFAFGIQTSANINTNPRTEQGVITIDRGLYLFYKEYFDDINSFEKV